MVKNIAEAEWDASGNWDESAGEAAAKRCLDAEVVVFPELDKGAYTAIVSGINNGTGNARVDVIELD